MAFENKEIPQQYRYVDIEEYNFLRKNKSRDRLSKLLIILLSAASLISYVIVLYSNALKANPYGPVALYILLAAASTSIFVIVFTIILLMGKNKRLDNSEHLYFFKQEKSTYKIVDNFSDASISISDNASSTAQEFDENNEPIYYAEEVYDDEEDIFSNEVQSTLLKKEQEITYANIVENFNHSLETFGIQGDLATQLLGAMAFTKLIDVSNIIKIVPTLLRVLDNPNYVIHYDENDGITTQKVLFNAFEYAKTHPTIPVFMLFDEIPAKEFINYLRPLYRYIDDLNGDYYITTNGTALHIPHNLYFLYSLKEKETIFDISRRYLRYISIVKCDYKINKDPELKPEKFSLTNEQLKNARRNAMELYSIEESTFKKLDLLFNMANEANGYVLQNKIQRKIEEYSALMLSLNHSEEDVIDSCLANNIISAVVISAEPLKLTKDYNLITLLENEFGQDKMKLTKAMIKEYLNLFNAKGERKDD